MERALSGTDLTELMEDIDSNLTYGGARRISEYEAELLDQLDDTFDNQLRAQRELDSLKRESKRSKEELEKIDSAIGEYCSETTRKKILLARGWQFMSEEADKIKGALSDKDVFRLSEENGMLLTFQQIGQGTTRDFSSNPEQASKVFWILENGVKTQEEIKEGQTQGEE